MIICIITKLHCKSLFKCRIYMASLQHAGGVSKTALKDPTALPRRFHSSLSNTLCKRQAAAFVLSMAF